MTMRLALLTLLLSGFANAQDSGSPLSTFALKIDTGVPLHIRVDHTVDIAVGYEVEGTLTSDIWAVDRIALPKGTQLRGVVTSLEPMHGLVKVEALLNGDVTPLHEPVVHFAAARLPDGRSIPIDAEARPRATQMVEFTGPASRPSVMTQAKTEARQRIQDARNTVKGPDKKDRALKLFYSQLPYHPQRLWAGSQLIADTTAPARVDSATEPVPRADVEVGDLDGVNVTARLTTPLTSKSTPKGSVVTAVITEPVFDKNHSLVLAEGSSLQGLVLSSKPARSLSRNGELHFAIRSVERSGVAPEHVDGTLAGAEGSKDANISVDREGNIKSKPDKNRFVAPILLTVLAVAGNDGGDGRRGADGGDMGGQTVASNGFGLIARIIALTAASPNVATGFGAYAAAKSITFRLLMKGHEVTFPKDTLVKVRLSAREATSGKS